LADAAGGRVELGVAIDETVVIVSTAADLGRNVVTRVYDIRDLLVVVPDFEAGPGEPAPTTKPSREQLVNQIEKLISDTVEFGHWTDSPDTKFTPNRIRELSGQLIVTATPKTQKEIAALLDQLR